MERQTRINKYKELREEMKEAVAIDRQVIPTVESDEDDDFLTFLPQEEETSFHDTLIEPLSYETLDKDSEDVEIALNEVKANVGKEQHNTRLDILNKIKQDDEFIPVNEYRTQDFEKGHVVKEAPQKKMSLLEKLAAMSPQEDAEELKRFEEDMTITDFMKSQKKAEKVVDKVDTTEVIENVKDEESLAVKILNYAIIVFIVIFLVLVAFIVKQILF